MLPSKRIGRVKMGWKGITERIQSRNRKDQRVFRKGKDGVKKSYRGCSERVQRDARGGEV